MHKMRHIAAVNGDICIMVNQKLQKYRKNIPIPLAPGQGMGYNVRNPEKEIQSKERSI